MSASTESLHFKVAILSQKQPCKRLPYSALFHFKYVEHTSVWRQSTLKAGVAQLVHIYINSGMEHVQAAVTSHTTSRRDCPTWRAPSTCSMWASSRGPSSLSMRLSLTCEPFSGLSVCFISDHYLCSWVTAWQLQHCHAVTLAVVTLTHAVCIDCLCRRSMKETT